MKLIQKIARFFGLGSGTNDCPRDTQEELRLSFPYGYYILDDLLDDDPKPVRKAKGRPATYFTLHPRQKSMVRNWKGSTSSLARRLGVAWTTADKARKQAEHESFYGN
jgi:hypothetical protein